MYKYCAKSHTKIFFQERKQANNLFKGKKGQKFREEVVKKSKTIPDDEDGQPRNLHVEDAKKIEEAIASASSLVEVERLQAILQSGRIPESGWNRESIGNITENAEKDTKESNGFVAEQEDDDDDVRSPIANPADDDVNDDVQSPVASPPHEIQVIYTLSLMFLL
ncbi:unnamed protein product [Brugia pahangi]|uniref:Uncharacterized protein n=1 Tax=Brugia pahangi TaxID=6280 RepID=A0A0N4TBK2_BRUPA|nr:unnamed protein product [Brugia pahangi]